MSVAAGSFGFDFPFSLPWSGILGAVLVSAFIGIVFGYAPAKKAAQMDPIAALKSEA
jgi:putative ABC transport system permease protein